MHASDGNDFPAKNYGRLRAVLTTLTMHFLPVVYLEDLNKKSPQAKAFSCCHLRLKLKKFMDTLSQHISRQKEKFFSFPLKGACPFWQGVCRPNAD